ncbi:MAG: response regulator [Burkholderiaceae bacterium]
MSGDFSHLRALVIDDSHMARMTLSGVLRDVGIGRIKGVTNPHHARVHLQSHAYDVILCEYHFSSDETGQDLLDEIRYQRLIPFRTVFFMVTGEASYEKVAEVVENAPDDYLLKPFKPAALEERLHKALAKKLALLPIYEKMEAADYDGALERCETLVRNGDAQWLHAARIGAELCLYLKRHARASEFYDLVLKAKALPWAKLGLAQLAYATSDATRARGALEALVSDTAAYADAYDLLARIYVEEGALGEALATLRSAVQATPANPMRLQKLGSFAFFIGEPDEAEAALAKAFRLGAGSRAFDWQGVALLAMLRLDRGDTAKELDRLCIALAGAVEKDPDAWRLRATHEFACACASMARRNPTDVVARLKTMEKWIDQPQFDFETACGLLSLLSRVASQEIRLPEAPHWIERIARRHCASKTAADLLLAALRGVREYVEIADREHARVNQLANEAMSRLVKGDADGAAHRLTELARKTLNARLFGLAESLALRHRERLSDASMSLILQAQEMRHKYCAQGTHVALARLAEGPRGGRVLPVA